MAEEVAQAGRGLPPARHVAELAMSTPTTEFTPPERAPTVTIPRAETPRQRRMRRLRKFVLWLAVIAAVVAGAWAAWTYLVPHYANIPNVRNMSQQSAFNALKDAGFKPVTGPAVFSVDIPPGNAVSTTPSIGAHTRTGTTVSVSFSKGPKIVPVPSVVNLPKDDAVTKLKDAGLKPIVKTRYSDTVPQGIVIDSNPNAGVSIQQGQPVTLFVSRGPAPIDVPDVTGRSVADATSVLEANGLQVGNITQEFSSTVPKGDVISTQPKAGTAAHRTDTVDLVVSKGPKTFPMPDVRGESEADATRQLQALGLKVKVQSLGPGSPSGIVVAQSPGAGTVVEQGEQVTIYILS
jgi:serine/threonine-protein kinase